MENEQDLGYFSRFVAEKIGISKDTLRSWSLKLETQGIKFERNPRGDRIYYQKDIHALAHMHELLGLQQPLNNVVDIVSEKMKEDYYTKDEVHNNEEKTLSVIQSDNGLITDQERMEQFKTEIITDLRKVMREEFKVTMEEVMKKEREQMATEVLRQITDQLAKQRLQELSYKEDTSDSIDNSEAERKLLAEKVATEILKKMNQERIDQQEKTDLERINQQEKTDLEKKVANQTQVDREPFWGLLRRFKRN